MFVTKEISILFDEVTMDQESMGRCGLKESVVDRSQNRYAPLKSAQRLSVGVSSSLRTSTCFENVGKDKARRPGMRANFAASV